MRCSSCPVAAGRLCVCEDEGGLCSRPEYRELAARFDAHPERYQAPDPPGPPLTEARKRALLPLVASCPDRGPVLPVSAQPECGCAELTVCRARGGRVPGRVTLQDCLHCVSNPSGASQGRRSP